MKNLLILIIMSVMLVSCEKETITQKDEILGKWKTEKYCNSPVSYDCTWQFEEDSKFTLTLVTPSSSVLSVGTFRHEKDSIHFDCSYYGKDVAEIISLSKTTLSVRFYVGGIYEFKRME